MTPLVPHVKAEWSSHSGEEFIYIISGSVELYMEFYTPAALNMGDNESLVFDDVVVGRQAAAAEGVRRPAGSRGDKPGGRDTGSTRSPAGYSGST